MMVRVYALHNRSRPLDIAFSTWFLLCRAHGSWLFAIAIVLLEMQPNKYCVTQQTVSESKQFGAVVVFNQVLIRVLMYWKYRRNART
ncbi:hypothetical protein AN958_02745 [Leucoagaricus sp. SymC.cos]|nr:hypothetical protein AN958_02745 [Leucoagaricus sp. SymC.cos]